VIEDVVKILKERGATLAVAESCTGGRIASAFTARAGASGYFLGGVVAYSNDVKVDVLGVDREVLERHGAVSREVAGQMVAGALRVLGADYAIATTGIAGPGGGSAEKPVGTVWIAVARLENDGRGGAGEVVETKLFRFDGSREEIMESAVNAAIELLTENLGDAME
jgi:nicotinamide-nucleotide amidase